MIPLYKPYLGKEEAETTVRVLNSRKLTRGREVEMFEESFSSFVGKTYTVAVNSGTSGLHLAVKSMGWKKGDEVITTPFTYIASANSILYEGAKPIFVDIDPRTLNIDLNKIEEKITPATKGLLLVHILGTPVCDLEKILYLKKKYNLGIIEDACEALGKPGSDFPVGMVGDLIVYSFHENKQITTAGEGGAIVTNNSFLAKYCSSMRDQGRSLEKDWINHVDIGFNYRLTEIQAAFGSVQLGRINKILEKRQKIAERYSENLKGISGLKLPSNDIKRSWFLYFVIFDSPKNRDLVYEHLLESNIISSKNYFPVIYKFPSYQDVGQIVCANSESISERLLALPTFYELTDEVIENICNLIRNVLK